MEVLSQRGSASVSEGCWHHIRTSRHGLSISHLFFADDLLLFGAASMQQAMEMDYIMTKFCKISGQIISLHKSQILISKNIACQFNPSGFTSRGITCTSNLGKYLSIPLIHVRTNKQTYGFIIDNDKDKLSAWRAKMLSQAAQCLLVKTVISSMPSYALQTVRLPARLIEELERSSRRFFWGETDVNTKLHWCNWRTICQPLSTGGPGIKRLRDMNSAMLAKLG